jgi:hypothetical protein
MCESKKGPTDQKIKLRKIKQKYLGFRGGDLAPICTVKTAFKIVIYMRATSKKYFFYL